MKQSAVFIDLDHTLLKAASFRTFVLEWYFRSDRRKIHTLFWHYGLRLTRRIDTRIFKERCLSPLRGHYRAQMELIGYDFYGSTMKQAIRPYALLKLAEWQRDHLPTFVATASPDFYVKHVADDLRMSGYFATELEYDTDDCFTGRFQQPECYGHEKARLVSSFAASHGIDLTSSFFLTDSYSDHPLLEVIGNPIAVCPDRKLRQFCKTKNWPIEYW